MTTDTNQTVASETPDTETVSVAKADQNNTTEQGSCGGQHDHCGGKGRHGRCDWKNNWKSKRRAKIIGAAVLIALLGFMLGRGCEHHGGHRMEGRHGDHRQMQSFDRDQRGSDDRGGMNASGRGGDTPALSTILDGIGATSEQRSKAVELFQK